MGFKVEYIVDIQKFPSPLYQRYKFNDRRGARIEVPSEKDDILFEVTELFPSNTYELVFLTVATTEYDDKDCWSLFYEDQVLFSSIYIKGETDRKQLRPVRRFTPGDNTLTFVWHNNSGRPKTVWLDFECTCRNVNPNDILLPDRIVPKVVRLGQQDMFWDSFELPEGLESQPLVFDPYNLDDADIWQIVVKVGFSHVSGLNWPDLVAVGPDGTRYDYKWFLQNAEEVPRPPYIAYIPSGLIVYTDFDSTNEAMYVSTVESGTWDFYIDNRGGTSSSEVV